MKYPVQLCILCLPFLTFSSAKLIAQSAPPPAIHLEQSNVAFQKRVERVIDMREKQNLVLMAPQNHLPTLLLRNVLNGTLRGYESDTFGTPIPDSSLAKLGCFTSVTSVIDQTIPDEEVAIDTVITTCDLIEKVTKLRVIEDWIFNKETGTMEARIVAIAPIYRPVYGNIELNEMPMFWVRWQENDTLLMSARSVFQNYQVFSRPSDVVPLSFTHFFESRMFSSYITKQSNEFDNRIKDMEEFADDPMLSLLESERLKKLMFQREHDLWEY